MRKIAAAAVWILWIGLATAPAFAGDNARGRALYDLCAQCHGPDGGGMQLSLAPAIAGLDQWYVQAQVKLFQSGARGTNWQDVGGLRMHPMSRWLQTDEDITAVSSYVSSLPPLNPAPTVVGGNQAQGKALYATCAACHGAEGKGNESMNAPPLVHMSDWYLVEALEKYKKGIRGGNPANTNAVLMRGMANILPNDQAIKDVVAYITALNQ